MYQNVNNAVPRVLPAQLPEGNAGNILKTIRLFRFEEKLHLMQELSSVITLTLPP